MNSVAERVRTIEVAEKKLDAQDQRLAELQRGRQTTADAVAIARRDLVLALAMERGVLDLPAVEIVAAFQRLDLAVSWSGRSPSEDLTEVVSALQLGKDEMAHITVQYTGYRRGERVALLQEIGLTRGGTHGYWHGQVDAAQLDRLTKAFPGKVNVDSVHAGSTLTVNSTMDESTAASETAIEVAEVDVTPPAIERSVPQAAAHPAPQPTPTSAQLPRGTFSSWPRRASTGGAGSDGEKLQ
jgi:hypothetical protein